jgi:hypothetical protein
MSIVIKTEVEPTPELIADILSKHAAKSQNEEFPYPAGTFVELSPDIVSALQGAPGMPALVMMTGKGFPLGVIAIHKIDGDVTVAYLGAAQVKGKFKV